PSVGGSGTGGTGSAGVSDVDGHLKSLPEGWKHMPRMLKKIPVTVRKEIYDISAVPCLQFERRYLSGNKVAAGEALLRFLSIARTHFTRVRAGKAHSKSNAKQLERKLQEAAVEAKVELKEIDDRAVAVRRRVAPPSHADS